RLREPEGLGFLLLGEVDRRVHGPDIGVDGPDGLILAQPVSAGAPARILGTADCLPRFPRVVAEEVVPFTAVDRVNLNVAANIVEVEGKDACGGARQGRPAGIVQQLVVGRRILVDDVEVATCGQQGHAQGYDREQAAGAAKRCRRHGQNPTAMLKNTLRFGGYGVTSRLFRIAASPRLAPSGSSPEYWVHV